MKKVICRDKDNNKKEVEVDALQFRPSVYGIIFNDDKTKILLSKQWDGYDYPGGGVKKGERLAEALKREVHEEVGVTIDSRDTKLIDCTDDFYIVNDERALHSILIFYVVNKFTGEPNIKNIDQTEIDYINGFEWVEIKNIEKIKFYNPVDNIELIQKAIELIKK
jgi:8-oxo-dGTP pyrophosphatase MutT (NUDIX family)